MLPPHLPQNNKSRGHGGVLKRAQASRVEAKPPARVAFGNIRRRLKKAPTPLRPDLRILDVARS
jgi:hypothetical protein